MAKQSRRPQAPKQRNWVAKQVRDLDGPYRPKVINNKMKLADFKLMETTMPKGVQAIVDFGKYELSIIQNEMSYGGNQGLYEISVFNGGEQVELPGITNDGDTVKGYLTIDAVDAIINKMFTITGTEGKQI